MAKKVNDLCGIFLSYGSAADMVRVANWPTSSAAEMCMFRVFELGTWW